MKKENEVLLRELERTQKDYRAMLTEFMALVEDKKQMDQMINRKMLNKTSEIVTSHQNFSYNSKISTDEGRRPMTTVN